MDTHVKCAELVQENRIRMIHRSVPGFISVTSSINPLVDQMSWGTSVPFARYAMRAPQTLRLLDLKHRNCLLN